MKIQGLSILLAATMIASTAHAGTAEEVRDVVKANMAHTNKMMSQDSTRISKHGS